MKVVEGRDLSAMLLLSLDQQCSDLGKKRTVEYVGPSAQLSVAVGTVVPCHLIYVLVCSE